MPRPEALHAWRRLRLLRLLRLPLLLVASLVAVERVLLYKHHPSDVWAGAILGLAISAVLAGLRRRGRSAGRVGAAGPRPRLAARALELQPDDHAALMLNVDVLIQSGQLEDAGRTLEALQQLERENAFAVVGPIVHAEAVGRDAQQVFQGLLRKGLIIRPLAGFAMPRHIRVTVGTEAENAEVLAALKEDGRPETGGFLCSPVLRLPP